MTSLLILKRGDDFMESLGYVKLGEEVERIQGDTLDTAADKRLDPPTSPLPPPSSPTSPAPPSSTDSPDAPDAPNTDTDTVPDTPNTPDTTPDAPLPEPVKLFKFYDDASRSRPDYSSFPSRDVPSSSFPDTSWQNDAVYLNHFIQEGVELIDRTLQAIVSEYGGDASLFKTSKVSESDFASMPKDFPQPPGAQTVTTPSSFQALSRRILHAIVSESSFTVVMAGHSSAAGHGNNFRQSAIMQFEAAARPLFKLLGVDLVAKNMAMGSFGTVQSSLAGEGVYGKADVVVWDSSMTENAQNFAGDKIHKLEGFGKTGKEDEKLGLVDLFWRSWDEPPHMILAEQCSVRGNVCKDLGNLAINTGADIAVLAGGWGELSLPLTKDVEHGMTLPKSVAFENCDDDINLKEFCKSVKCEGLCWLDRDDGTKPNLKQLAEPKGCVSWHPGWRFHKYRGRLLTQYILMAARAALEKLQEETDAGEIPISDEDWHMSSYYSEVRAKINAFPVEQRCSTMMWFLFDAPNDPEKNLLGDEEKGHARICKLLRRGITGYTPVADNNTLLSRLVGVQIPELKQEFYTEPDDYTLESDIVEIGAVDVVSVASGFDGVGRGGKGFGGKVASAAAKLTPTRQLAQGQSELPKLADMGWQVIRTRVGECDGTSSTRCNRDADTNCVLYGHHDGEGGLLVEGGPSEELEFDLGLVTGGWVAFWGRANGVKNNDNEFKIKATVVDRNGEVVHEQIIETALGGEAKQSKKYGGGAGGAPDGKASKSAFPVWNDPEAETGEYSLRIKVLKADMFLLTHVYWSVGGV
eukprot:CAMPEP_0197560036 /NCGR_PEP_ID=MMETSP1320-20131121/22387_1 /TAXON_ID=91990 /ORGANISM="Bolidomonas sp., Strain RCC2347" /LENGTH=805 /DNA_ID=CAMNT_0043121551 /DNA_START=357 /DNA_END=2774 /DNA_ORIENTATION=-